MPVGVGVHGQIVPAVRTRSAQHPLGDQDGARAVGRHQADPGAPVEQVATVRAPSCRTANRSSPTVSGRPSTTGSVPSAATTGASVPYRATSRAGRGDPRAAPSRGAAPTSGSRPVSERGSPRPSRATTASTVSSAIAR